MEKDRAGTSVAVPFSGEGELFLGDIEGRAKIFRVKVVLISSLFGPA